MRRLLQLHVPQILRRILGRRGVDVEARAPFEARNAGEPRHDLQVPVKVVVQGVPVPATRHAVRRGVEHVVVGRVVQHLVEAPQGRAERA